MCYQARRQQKLKARRQRQLDMVLKPLLTVLLRWEILQELEELGVRQLDMMHSPRKTVLLLWEIKQKLRVIARLRQGMVLKLKSINPLHQAQIPTRQENEQLLQVLMLGLIMRVLLLQGKMLSFRVSILRGMAITPKYLVIIL